MSEANGNGSGRDPMTGRALPGNRLSAGNRGSHPTARRMAELRAQFTECVTPEHLKGMYVSLTKMALGGDVAAIKLWLEYAIGKPVQALELSGPDGGSLGLDVASLTRVVLVALAGHPDARLAVAEALGRVVDDGGA